jgi:tonB protein
MCRSSEKLPVCKKFLTNLCLPKISGIDIIRPSKQRGTTVSADSNEFNLLSRRENVMNIKNILPTTLLVVGLFTAQTAAAEVRFFQDAGRADTDSAAIEWMQHQTMQPVFVNGEAKDFRIVKEIKFAA